MMGARLVRTGLPVAVSKFQKDWLTQLYEAKPDHFELTFSRTLCSDKRLTSARSSAFLAQHLRDRKIVQKGCLDHLMHTLTWRKKTQGKNGHHLAYRIRDHLNDHLEVDIVAQDIADDLGYDPFQINRAFKSAFALTPHLYLIRSRLARAHTMLAQGQSPNMVAHTLCFSDQSHLGRWFKRAYRLTPANYQKCCAPPF